jgi:hypothetical protein
MTEEQPSKAMVSFAEMRIRIWEPMDQRDPFMSKIGTLPILFYGATPMQANMKAQAWRKAEIAKLDKRGSRQKDVIPAPDPLTPGDT